MIIEDGSCGVYGVGGVFCVGRVDGIGGIGGVGGVPWCLWYCVGDVIKSSKSLCHLVLVCFPFGTVL